MTALTETTCALARAVEELTEQLGRAPSAGQLARATGLDLEQVVEALRARAEAIADEPFERGRRVLYMRLVCGMTQTQIAARLDLTQPQVAGLLRRGAVRVGAGAGTHRAALPAQAG